MERLHSIVRKGVFPLSYAACTKLVARIGFKPVVASFRAHVLASLDDLGHTLTIWESFVELAKRPLSDSQRLYAAERLVEFLGSPSFAERPDVDQVHASAEPLLGLVARAVRAQGFMGHTVITLSTVLRMDLAPEEQAQVSRVLARVMTKTSSPLRASEASRTLADAVRYFLLHGPRDVHTLTFARAAWDLRGILKSSDEPWLVQALMAESGRELRHG